MNGLLDKFFTHLALVRSVADVDGKLVVVAVVVAGVVVMEVNVLMLNGM